VTTPDQANGERGAWSSALSTNDYAACIEAGLQPIAFVQGCTVVSWSFYGLRTMMQGSPLSAYRPSSGYFEQFNCPHGFVSAEHRLYGMNYEQTWVEGAWMTAFSGALARLLEEAQGLGAHGVIGIVDHSEHHPESTAYEFRLSGTAVGVEGIAPPSTPFTTFLAGQKLNKLVEAGFAPVSIALTYVSVGVYESCVTEYQLRGGSWTWGGPPTGEVDQVSRAHEAARSTAREEIRRQLAGDSLHAAHLFVASGEAADGPHIDVTLRGNRVRRFKDFEPIPPPRPVLRLVDP
jgi:hypothetical protein